MGTVSSISSAHTGSQSSAELLEAIHSLISEDLAAVDHHIQSELKSDVALIDQIGHYIIGAGGKRLRPVTLVLGAHTLGYQGTAHIDLAAVIEFIHTATLLHDDVVDESELRRGRETANDLWGNSASVLVGDFLYSRAFQMMVAVGNPKVMDIMAQTTNAIAQGEVMQLINSHDPETSEAAYLETITRKTARLFESAARLGAVLADASPASERVLGDFGLNLGISFQMLDDALDYSSDAEQMGKNAGDDLEKAVITGYETVLGREPHEDELSATLEFLKVQEDSYAEAKQANPRELALADFAQTLFGLNEFSYLR